MLGPVGKSLGIAVVHYRAPEVALDCLERLEVAAPGAQVVVVDTAPEPDFRARLTARFPEARFLAAPNHSYSRSVNLGISALATERVALMNADVLVEPDTFRKLESALNACGNASVVAPLALTREDRPQDMGLPYAWHYRRLGSASRSTAQQGDASAPTPASVEVPWVAGYLQLMPRALWDEVGGYDESFRFFNEDIDFCLRVRRAGYGCRLVDAPVLHLGGTSTPAHPAFHVEGRRGGMLITRRHYGPARRAAHTAFLWSEALLGSLLARSEDHRAAHAMMLEMLRSGAWHSSPFGATLDERRSGVKSEAEPPISG